MTIILNGKGEHADDLEQLYAPAQKDAFRRASRRPK
jgi:hypothetical protein